MRESTAAVAVHDALREWAKGIYSLEAATELLIRLGWADPSLPWVVEADEGRYWLDFARIPDLIGAKSGGEQRFLLVAASIGAESVQVSLNECLSGLDRDTVDLILAALAHTAGTHEGNAVVIDEDAGTLSVVEPYQSLHPWPKPRLIR